MFPITRRNLFFKTIRIIILGLTKVSLVTSRKRLKGKKIMKKMILLAVALFSMTATFAADKIQQLQQQ